MRSRGCSLRAAECQLERAFRPGRPGGGKPWNERSFRALIGTVRERATEAPLADVVVRARSASRPVEQVVVTDAGGHFRIPQLPPGPYTLRFERDGLTPLERTPLPLQAGRTLRVDGVLEVDAMGPGVGSTHDGAAVGADFVRNIAAIRCSLCAHGHTRRHCGSGSELFLPEMPPGQGSRAPSWTHPYAPIVRPTGEPQNVHDAW